MNTEGDKQDGNEDVEDLDDGAAVDPEQTVVLTEMPVANSISDTAELKVDALLEKVEAQSQDEVHRKKEIRRRLEDLTEEGSFEDTYALDLGDSD